MSSSRKFFIGLDSGSVSLNAVVMSPGGEVLDEHYDRLKGDPAGTCRQVLARIFEKFPRQELAGVALTGSGGKLLSGILGGFLVNEVLAQSRAIARAHPEVRSVIEMGGEDSKLLIMRQEAGDRWSRLEDFSMNTVCAAGTGSFLDQQAARIGVSIEGAFGELAGRSRRPPRIAGRCSVFAKSDMIHLQQIATPVHDIVAGLCFALARNFKSDICRGKEIEKPVAFQGGVAANSGMVRAFREVLGLEGKDFIIPRHFASMGAIGAVLLSQEAKDHAPAFRGTEALEHHLREARPPESPLDPLPAAGEGRTRLAAAPPPERTERTEIFLGIDIGSISTNVVAVDREKRLLSKRYLMTASRPIEAVRRGLREVGEELSEGSVVLGVGTTGSGRYMIGDYVGADIVRNEITAQATAALHFDPEVDTIFEIGGQDSKYIGLRDGAVVDFEMNKVCAAGTGSFIEEQAERLGINIDGEFGSLSLEAPSPSKLGERCTVFMDSDLVKQQQRGTAGGNLAAGLCYSIVHNYLNKVVGDREVGRRIFLQGGIAFNEGVVAAFEKVTGRHITVPPHHDVTGAIGAALLAMERAGEKPGSAFKGFDLASKEYRQDTFGCKSCSNACEINRVRVDGEKPLFYGGRCEKYEIRRGEEAFEEIPAFFEERERLLLGEDRPAEGKSRGRVGVPRVLHFYEFYPFWKGFLEELGFEAVPSPPSTGAMIRDGTEAISAEACFPVKMAHGHVLSLLKEGVDAILLPSFISFPKNGKGSGRNVTCPYSQAMPYLAKATMGERIKDVRLLSPVVDQQWGRDRIYKALLALGKDLGASKTRTQRAFRKAEKAQEEFYAALQSRGREALRYMEESGRKALILVGRSYNTCDSGVNLNFPKKIRELGYVAIPLDFLPLADYHDETDVPNMYWRTGQRIMAAVRYLRQRNDMLPIYLTNFGCGPDSFISHFFKEEMEGRPYLQIEVDEHSADAGAVTRLEAFLDSLPSAEKVEAAPPVRRRPAARADLAGRTLYLLPMADHAAALAGVFRALGQPAEVLPESDEESALLGRSFTSGKECYPCIVTSGDIVRKVREPGFDPDRSAFFMPTGDGPCRFGQYRAHHERVLRQLGVESVPLVSPAAEDSYAGVGQDFQRLAWDGIVAVDLLDKLRRRFRPYAVDPGEAEKIYRLGLKEIEEAIAGRRNPASVLEEAAGRFSRLDLRDEERPLIGVVGEIFLRSNEFSNEDLVRKIEHYGGEVALAPIAEWIFYTNFTANRRSLRERRYGDFARGWVKDRYQRRRERRLLHSIEEILGNGHEPPVEKLLELSSPYLHDSFEGEAVLTVGKSVDMAMKGVSGVVSAMPFTCMPGTISSTVSKKVRDDHDALPFLNMVYDGQGGAGSEVRIEAFVHQARMHSGRTNGGPSRRQRADRAAKEGR